MFLAVCRWLSPWSWDELLVLHALLEQGRRRVDAGVPLPTVAEAYDRFLTFGGIPQYVVFETPEELNRKLEQAMYDVKLTTVCVCCCVWTRQSPNELTIFSADSVLGTLMSGRGPK